MRNDTLSLYKEIRTYTAQLDCATEILCEVWRQVRLPFRDGFSGGRISTYEDVCKYLQARGILDEQGRFEDERSE